METVAYYNGKISEIDDMMIPMADRGFTFGDGVYDATMARHQKIFALDEHLERFWRSMAAVMITPDFTREELTNILNTHQRDRGSLYGLLAGNPRNGAT